MNGAILDGYVLNVQVIMIKSILIHHRVVAQLKLRIFPGADERFTLPSKCIRLLADDDTRKQN